MGKPVMNVRPTITLVNGTRKEQLLQEQLLSLFDCYSLDKWLYTEKVNIKEGVIPHSHPVLTLSPQTRGVDFDYLANLAQLLGTYIHEQLHWFLLLESKFEAYKNASNKFRALYPSLPTECPEGCGSSRSNYLHIQVNYLEYQGLRELLGEDKARAVFKRIPYYTAICTLVLQDYEKIGEAMTRYKLTVAEHPPEIKRFVDVSIPEKPI